MIIKYIICVIFLCVINITDIKGYKIKNNIVLPTIIMGLICAIINNSFLDSVYGMLIPLVLFPLYALKMLGAGDVKALCAIGSVLGFKLSVETMLFTFVAGGIIALLFMICNRNFVDRFKHLFNYLKTCFLMKKIDKYNFGEKNKSYFRFSYAITVGTILAIVNNYLCII